MEKKLITWDCPLCGEENIDLQDDYTHCSWCGEVVWVLDEDYSIDDQYYKVDIEKKLWE